MDLKKTIQMLLLTVSMVCVTKLNATIRYVKVVSTGDASGSSWANASASLQAMINASAAGDEVWVAEGTYLPTDSFGNVNPLDPRTKTFSVKKGIKIYGGFSSTGNPAFSQRNWGNYTTTLSGDIGQANDSSDNCYHVLSILLNDSSTSINGFVIEKGNANFSNFTSGGGTYNNRDCGGAVYILSTQSHVNFSNCVFTQNMAHAGGAIIIEQGLQTFVNCVFAQNYSTWYGFMFGVMGPDGKYDGSCVLSTNYATPKFINCTFSLNSSNGSKNAVLASDGGSTFFVQNCIINHNLDNGIPIDNLALGATFNSSFSGGIDTNFTPIPMGNLLNVDPMFVNIGNPKGADGKWMTADDGLLLKNNSPCINKGDSTYLSSAYNTDITGASRVRNSNVDMGAYEFQSSTLSSSFESSGLSLSIFPNPATEAIYITIDLKGTSSATVELTDVMGQIIKTYNVQASAQSLLTIPTVEMSKGMYIVNLSTGNNRINKRITLQ